MSQKLLTKKVIFSHFEKKKERKKNSIFSKIWCQKWIVWLDHFHSENVYLYIHYSLKGRAYSTQNVLKKHGLTPPFKEPCQQEKVSILVDICVFMVLGKTERGFPRSVMSLFCCCCRMFLMRWRVCQQSPAYSSTTHM